MNFDLQLEEKVAIVTGAGSGIGASIAQLLAEGGCVVYVADINLDNANQVASSLERDRLKAEAVKIDVSDSSEVIEEVNKIGEKHNRIDILVNNAGILKTESIFDSSIEDWDLISKVNLSSVFYCSKAVMPFMVDQQYGKIINIASVSAVKGGGAFGNTLYGTTKAGVVALTKGLGRELGPKGINVNGIAPAVTETAMTSGKLTEEVEKEMLKSFPLGRLAKTTDIANVAAFLCSDKADYITGQTVMVDGGFTIK